MRLVSWNVNGMRSVLGKGFEEWLQKDQPDILCLQETRVLPEQLPSHISQPEGYTAYWNPAQKKGYSGVSVWTKVQPVEVRFGMGIPEFDEEGRLLELDFGHWVLINGYYPNGGASPERLEYKMRFYEAFLLHIQSLRNQGKEVVFCGDLNTCHREIDIARPKENQKVSGFLPMEREWMDRVCAAGWLDTFRVIHPEQRDVYSWWSNRAQSRARNVGWRIDYFFASEGLKEQIEDAQNHTEILGSDHCPISLTLSVQ